jgi:hypothetical protein
LRLLQLSSYRKFPALPELAVFSDGQRCIALLLFE